MCMPRERLSKDMRRPYILALTSGRETAYNNQKEKNRTLGKRKNLIFRVTTLLDSHVHLSKERNHRAYINKIEWPIQIKKKCLTDTVPEKELRADLLDKTL